MKIVMIASNYFPIRDVSSIRIHSYCKALAKIGVEVTVLIIYPTDEINIPIQGEYEGVHYRFVTDKRLYSRGILYKLYSRLLGLNGVRKIIKEERIDVVLTYHDNFLSNLIVRATTYFSSIPFIVDKTEYPYGYFKMSYIQKQIADLNLRFFTGFIVISKELKIFYSKYSKNIFLLPMTIDPNRFDGLKRSSNSEAYIALTFGSHNRDGLFESIQAYNIYVKSVEKNKIMKLFLIGDFDSLCIKFPECQKIISFISDNFLNDLVVFKGRVSIELVPELLADAKCLLTTPVRFESGGFPTKLGEYMLSSIPVVATNAGEISEYVNHHYDIFLSKVGDLKDVAQNILFVQNNPDFSRQIALNAKNTAQTKFNADTYSGELLKFFKKDAK